MSGRVFNVLLVPFAVVVGIGVHLALSRVVNASEWAIDIAGVLATYWTWKAGQR